MAKKTKMKRIRLQGGACAEVSENCPQEVIDSLQQLVNSVREKYPQFARDDDPQTEIQFEE